ncbi:MAG: class I tRNA ligase family protein [Phycisphaerales bacterium]|jgi:methionyl-tRNA synthetase|nr:class I tRNA ligase family protein [Phycisphaerales bacterium]
MSLDPSPASYYVTTPIYYVNDRPHIGHCYTTLIADLVARAQRLIGGPDRPVFFLTGTDEHAEKVVTSALEHAMTPQQWADHNAARFREAFAFMGFSNDDFVRTTEDRHKTRASAYIQRLVDQGDIELGDYTGWWDASQEEYVTESTAKEHDFKSPVTGRPLEKRTEQNYFFRLDKHQDWLLELIERGTRNEASSQGEPGGMAILPEARRNEIVSRIKGGLNPVPVSRRIKAGDADWGIRMPNDPEHRVYVWIEALCNYLTVVDTPERRRFWPRPGEGSSIVTHLMAKDIVWFHAVIWPAMLRALGETPPRTVYAHAYWIAEGKKMSKSLGNFIEIEQLRAYAQKFSLDAVRWYLATQGPLGATDADFAHARFVEVYNAELANGIGNCASRVANMVEKYFDGTLTRLCDGRFGFEDGRSLQLARKARVLAGNPAPDETRTFDLAAFCARGVEAAARSAKGCRPDDIVRAGLVIVREVDEFITYSAPFTLAKKMGELEHADKALATILYACAESLRIASLLLSPAMPAKMAQLWREWGCTHLSDPNDHNSAFVAPLAELAQWSGPHGMKVGQAIRKGEALFMRADPKEPAPGTPPTLPGAGA